MKFFAIAALIAAASALKVKTAAGPTVEGQRVTLSSPVTMELPIKGKATIELGA